MAESEREDRTEAASQKRLDQAREEGRVAISREVPHLVGLGAATLALVMLGPQLGRRIIALERFPARLDSFDAAQAGSMLRQAMLAALLLCGPLVAAVLLAGVSATLLQTGLVLNTKALMPDLARLDPRRGLKRVAGKDSLVQAARSVVKLAILGVICWHAIRGELPSLGQAPFWQPALLADRLLRAVLHILLLLLGAQAGVVALDVLWVRHVHNRSLRMSKQEQRDEYKESEGDPHVKGRRRQLQRARAKQRMMAAIPKATVVVTNPTHYAVALAYERGGKGAPRVVAKGVDEVAARIREMAKEHRVPLVASPPLARALYRVELEAEIPAEHFQAVAEIVAYVWRLGRRAGP
jgi:flagellar biosynthetic protein FlhB